MRYAWIQAHRQTYATTMMCELLSVSRSGLNAARGRWPSQRSSDDTQLVEEIRAGHRKHRGRYGRRRMAPQVSEVRGHAVNHKRVGRLMREHGLQSHKRRRFRVVTTDSKHAHPVAPNVLGRDFEAVTPNQKCLADITCVPTDPKNRSSVELSTCLPLRPTIRSISTLDRIFQEAGGDIVVIGRHPAEMRRHDLRPPIREEARGVEIRFVTLLDARHARRANRHLSHAAFPARLSQVEHGSRAARRAETLRLLAIDIPAAIASRPEAKPGAEISVGRITRSSKLPARSS